ncbi:MAG: DUF5606 domain-containing protein [Bacteroidales bacterium]|nr:DUF5606 domain-containing protein [Bacteroidales bacterium]
MDLSNILAIAGKPGLFKLVSQTKTGAVVESLLDGKRTPAFKNDKISSLSEICMFTNDEDYPLSEVFRNIYTKENKGQVSIDYKKVSTRDLYAYFSEVLPNMDEERVYPSDVKKALSWYNLLLSKDLIDGEMDKMLAERNGEENSEATEEGKE